MTCACGCGQQTSISKYSDSRRGCVKGQPLRFVQSHNMRLTRVTGYKGVRFRGQSMPVHRMRAEMALGKPLPNEAQVHHVGGGKDPNAQLVICQDQSYHLLLHTRARIVAAGGNPNTDRLCCRCNTCKPTSEFYRRTGRLIGFHAKCIPCQRQYNESLRVRHAS